MEFASIHKWDIPIKEAIALQKILKDKLVLKKYEGRFETVAGIDVSFPEKNVGLAVIIIMEVFSFSIIESIHFIGNITIPYIPGLLTFREGPLIAEAIKKVKREPDVLFFDGQGIAHPRGLGIAAHFGVLLQRPTIGIAKNHLYGDYDMPPNKKGSWTPLISRNDENIGGVLRTREGVKPVFVSPGNMINVTDSIEMTLRMTGKYKIPEPTRQAHILAQKLKTTLTYKEL